MNLELNHKKKNAVRRITFSWMFVLVILAFFGVLYGLRGWMLTLHLVILSLTGLCIFWPITWYIARQLAELRRINELLTQKTEELEMSRLAAFSIMEDAQLARKEAEQGRDDFARLAAIVESTDEAIIGETLDGVITSWNPAAERLYGYTAQEMIGQSVGLIFPSDRLLELPDILRQLKRGEKIINYETVRKRKDGRLIDVSLTISPTKGPGGEWVGGSAVGRDITELKRAREALADREKWFRALIEQSMDIIILLDKDAQVFYVSPPLTKIMGYMTEEWEGHNFFDFMHPNDIPSSKDLLADLLKKPNGIVMGQARFFHKDGQWRWLEGTGQNLLHEPSIRAVVINCRDITERKRTEARLEHFNEQLRQSNKELEQFAFVASHDLQEPLRIVASYVRLWGKRYGDAADATAEKYISYVTTNVERMQNMIQALLEYSRINRGEVYLHAVDAGQVCDQAIMNLQLLVKSKSVKVTRDPLPVVFANDVQLIQVFQNLISNGIKYCKNKKPAVHISAARNGQQIWNFSVKDNGIGIDPQYHQQIFEVFRRLHTKEEYPGTGIGLSICKKIVEKTGGRIWVESAENQGSTFYFTLREYKEARNVVRAH